MSTDQRINHIKKFNNFPVRLEDSHTSSSDLSVLQDITQGNFLLSSESLSISFEEAFAGTSVPEGVASGIWNKAASLLSDTDAISSAPGCSPKDKMVKSKSGLVPHLVASKKENQYVRDDKCPI